jgi:8-oxo-dGTP pyrophosphatase MutT (NUDIX family)
MADRAVSPADLRRWAEALATVARAGLGFTQSLYERERFEEVLKIAGDIRGAAMSEAAGPSQPEVWLHGSTAGSPASGGPKTAVGALVANDAGEILLVQRPDSGAWLFPAGLADVGYSPSEVAIKETLEETGIEVEPIAVAAVIDAARLGFHLVPLYVLVFACRMLGGELRRHPLETADLGFFARNALPQPLAGGGGWVDVAFAALQGELRSCAFDLPRTR